MRGLRALFVALALFCMSLTDGALAGAFTLEPGELKLFLTGLASAGDQYFDRDGRLHARGLYSKYDLQLSGEYGWRNGLTLFGSGGLQKIRAADGETYKRQGLGRSEFGLRKRVWSGDGWIVSAQGSVIVAGARDASDLAAIGETDDQLDIRGLAARSFTLFGKPAFIDVAAGYRFRSGDPADEIRLDGTFGIRTAPRTLLLAQSFNQIGTGRWSGPYPLKQRIHKLQSAVVYDLNARLQLVGAAFFSPTGRDALDERGATLGLGVKF